MKTLSGSPKTRAAAIALAASALLSACGSHPTQPSDKPVFKSEWTYGASLLGTAYGTDTVFVMCQLGAAAAGESGTLHVTRADTVVEGTYSGVGGSCRLGNGRTVTVTSSPGAIANGYLVAGDSVLRFDFDPLGWQHAGTYLQVDGFSGPIPTYQGDMSVTIDLGPPYGPTALIGSWIIL
jgi:hypothetical protein